MLSKEEVCVYLADMGVNPELSIEDGVNAADLVLSVSEKGLGVQDALSKAVAVNLQGHQEVALEL